MKWRGVATRWPRCFFLTIELRVRLESNSLCRQMITYSWILFSTPAPPPFISDTELGSSRVLMNESSFVPFLLLVLVGLFTAALFRFCLQSALVYFPIENALVSLTQKDLDRVQGPLRRALGKQANLPPQIWDRSAPLMQTCRESYASEPPRSLERLQLDW